MAVHGARCRNVVWNLLLLIALRGSVLAGPLPELEAVEQFADLGGDSQVATLLHGTESQPSVASDGADVPVPLTAGGPLRAQGARASGEATAAAAAAEAPEAQSRPELLLANRAERPFPPRAAGAYLWWLLILYMFFIMAVVCDDYLVPTVDIICERLCIPEDVAGATLMAFACNGPELLTNTCAIFITHSSVGMGTIVGSAIFNVMVITGACAIVVPGGVLEIPKGTFLRDSAFSAVSIVILAWALPSIDLFRASVLFGMSFVYIGMVARWRKIVGAPDEAELQKLEQVLEARRSQFLERLVPRRVSDFGIPTDDLMFDESILLHRQASYGESPFDYRKIGTSTSLRKIEVREQRVVTAMEAYNFGPENREEIWRKGSELTLRHRPTIDGEAAYPLLRGAVEWVWYIISAPTIFALYWTIPDVKNDAKKGQYVSAFLLSMLWLSSTAFVVCLGSDSIHYYWGIPQSFLGLTLAAAGTSWPNMLASMITAKCGRGPMAVSNALGSNVQNVFLVLAGPIWVRVLQKGDYFMEGDDIWTSIVWMAVTLGVCVVCVACQGWKLTARAGWGFCALYVVYVVQTTVSSAE